MYLLYIYIYIYTPMNTLESFDQSLITFLSFISLFKKKRGRIFISKSSLLHSFKNQDFILEKIKVKLFGCFHWPLIQWKGRSIKSCPLILAKITFFNKNNRGLRLFCYKIWKIKLKYFKKKFGQATRVCSLV